MLSVTPGQSFLQNLYNFVPEQHKIFTSVPHIKLKTEEQIPGKMTTLKRRYTMKSKLSKKFGTGVIVLLITVCFIPAIAGAFAPGDERQDKGIDRKGHHRPVLGIWRNPQMVQKLELTTEQVKQVRDADFTFRERCLELKAQLGGFHLKMDKAFSDEVVDNAAVLSLAEKISDIKGKLFVQKIEARLTVGKLLNADQIKKLKLYDIHQKKRDLRKGKKHIFGRHSVERTDDKTISDD
jgi:Spy/CpxP family protein refolding chaperone